jgi:hypothetical protein
MHRLELLTFHGADSDRDTAIAAACERLSAWYQTQTILFDMNGQSVFQISGSLTITPSGTYVYTLTVIDTRPEE